MAAAFFISYQEPKSECFLHPHNYHLPSKTAFPDYTLEQLDLFCAEDDFWANFRRGQVEEMYSKFSRDGSGVK